MEAPSNGLGKLLPKSITRRRKNPSSLAETASSNDDVALQKENSNLSRSTTRSDKTTNSKHERIAIDSGSVGDGDKTGVLITYDSDPEP